MKSVIICIGNRFVARDAAGPAVYDRLLQRMPLPEGVEVVDGGTRGLNLLPLLERGGRVVFVDAVSGFVPPGDIVLLTQQEIMETVTSSGYDHSAGLGYLLTVLPAVCEGEMPEEIFLVGLEGKPTRQTIEHAARVCIGVAVHGVKDNG